MGNHYLNILTAWTFATVPMLALAVAFFVSVEQTRPEAPPGSFYSDDEHNNMSLGSAVYSTIPSTQLTFIASFSSTIATAVLPAVMALFSSTVALAITRDSDAENHRRLPSPYQLELLISTLNGSLLTLWLFAQYLFSPRRRREAVVPNLWKASSLFSAIAILALLIAMTDAWLNFTVTTVQYTSIDDITLEQFTPGRGLPPACLDVSNQSLANDGCPRFQSGTYVPTDITYQSSEPKEPAHGDSDIVNEFKSWLVVDRGINTTIEFRAKSIGSTTSCKIVTSLCQIIYYDSPPAAGATSMVVGPGTTAFDCRRGIAGSPPTMNISDSSVQGFALKYVPHSDASMHASLQFPHGYPYAVLLQVPIALLTNHDAPFLAANTPETMTSVESKPGYGFVHCGSDAVHEFLGCGVLSCSTALSDVSYSFRNGSITTDGPWAVMNAAASSILSRLHPEEMPQLRRGLLLAISNANETWDIARAWERNFDQSHLTALNHVLLRQSAISSAHIVTIQVTRIPRAPFATLIVLDLLYATIGTSLMIAAVIAVRKGHGVKDAQARLSTLAVVAESFESPAWGDDAKNVDMLFAERRGEGARRIALVKRKGGGRRFKQIVVPQNYVKRPLPVTATKTVPHRPAGGGPGVRAPERAGYPYQNPVRAVTIPPAPLHQA